MEKIYKDLNNQVRVIDAEFTHLLPNGCIEISKEEADAILLQLVIPPTYAELRKAEYPPMSDYLDAIVKGDIEHQQAYIDACKAVKSKYPKP